MFLKPPKTSTDQRVRSLLQKAARRGYPAVAELALTYLDAHGDKNWLRSRAIVITFEECWPLASALSIAPGLSSKRTAILAVTQGAKQKDAAGLGALAYAYSEGDRSMLDCVSDLHTLKLVSESLRRPNAFFEWALKQSKSQQATDIIQAAQRYLAAATWPWDKACILAGALLAISGTLPTIESSSISLGEFPYWIALDKHTPEGKIALREVAKQTKASYRQLIWANFYYEGAQVNRLLPSSWWDAERDWRLRRAGMSLSMAQELWSSARSLVSQRLEAEATALRKSVDREPLQQVMPI